MSCVDFKAAVTAASRDEILVYDKLNGGENEMRLFKRLREIMSVV